MREREKERERRGRERDWLMMRWFAESYSFIIMNICSFILMYIILLMLEKKKKMDFYAFTNKTRINIKMETALL